MTFKMSHVMRPMSPVATSSAVSDYFYVPLVNEVDSQPDDAPLLEVQLHVSVTRSHGRR